MLTGGTWPPSEEMFELLCVTSSALPAAPPSRLHPLSLPASTKLTAFRSLISYLCSTLHRDAAKAIGGFLLAENSCIRATKVCVSEGNE